MRHYDLIISGCGFAGLACAKAASLSGLSVLVLERKEDLRDSIHTTGIFVQEAAAECPLPAHLTRPIAGIRLYAPSLKSIDLVRPGYHFLATDTPEVMQYLADEAHAAGAEILLGTPLLDAREENNAIMVNGHYACRFLVGADGARSRVAECFSLERNQHFLIGVEAEYEGVGGMEERLHCFIDRTLAPGYIGWAMPGAKVAQVGLACTGPEKPDIGAMVERISSLFDFSRARITGRRGGLIPVGGTLKNISRGNVLLVGDAAGMVSPLTAGGIHTALHHGQKLGNAIAAHMQDGEAHPALTVPPHYPHFYFKSLMRRGMDIFPPDWIFNAALSTAPFRRFAERVFFYK